MAPKVTKSNNSTTVKPTTVKKKPTPKKIDIAKAMMQFAEKNTGAIGKDGFQSLLKQVNKSNVIDVIKQYDKISPKKSIIAMILGETGSNDEEMESVLTGKGNGKSAVRGLFTLLLDKAKDVGVDSATIANFEKEFEKELDVQLGNNSILGQIRSLVSIDSTRLDTIMRAIVQSIDNQTTLSKADKQTLASTPATKLQADTNNIIGKRYNQALKDFNEQLAKDGWAGDVADFWGKIFSENSADAVRTDLKKCKNQYDELVAARKQGNKAYKAKFKEIFGVAYNPSNIKAYQNAEERYIEASKAYAQESNYNQSFSVLLNSRQLQEEDTYIISPTTGTGTRIITATKQQVYNREYKKFVQLLGEGGEALIQQKFKEAGIENKSIDEKFKVLQTLAKAVSTNLHNATMKATGGAEFESVQKHYDNCYKAAFGIDNDIMKRVTDYNISQQRGAGVVKGAAVMAIVTACALTGQVEGIVAVAGVAAGTTAVVEVTDAASQKRNIDAFKEGGLGAYLKSVGKNTDWGGIAKASLTSGAMMLAIGGASYPIANLCRISASAAGLTGKALDIATGLGTNAAITGGVLGSQYLMKGEITTEDAVFAVVMAVVGSTIQVLQINKAYAQAESAAVDAHVQNIQDARRTLGFEDGVEITPDMLKQQYKKMALANHPDKGGSNVNMAVINSAKDYLQAHIADINITLTGAKPQTINPTIEAARGNTTPQSNPAGAEGSNSTALVTRANLVEFRNSGYNLSTTPQNQIIACTPEGKTIEVGTLGNTLLAEVRDNLSNIKPGNLNVTAITPEPTVTTSQQILSNPKYNVVAKRINEIKEQFGVDVRFDSQPQGDIGAAVTEIYNELQNFRMHSAEGNKGLTTIKFNDGNETFWDENNSTITIGLRDGKVNIDEVRASIRHELVHDYETRPELGNEFPQSFNQDNIETYVKEMLNAGLSPDAIVYAFGNRKELLSIVSMSNQRAYSPSTQAMLKDAGFPDCPFTMNPISRNTYSPEQIETLTTQIIQEIQQKGGIGYLTVADGKYHSILSIAVVGSIVASSYSDYLSSSGYSFGPTPPTPKSERVDAWGITRRTYKGILDEQYYYDGCRFDSWSDAYNYKLQEEARIQAEKEAEERAREAERSNSSSPIITRTTEILPNSDSSRSYRYNSSFTKSKQTVNNTVKTADGTVCKYENDILRKETFADGTYRKYNRLSEPTEQKLSDGTIQKFNNKGRETYLETETLDKGDVKTREFLVDDPNAEIIEYADGKTYLKGRVTKEIFKDGTYKKYDKNKRVIEESFKDSAVKCYTYDEAGKQHLTKYINTIETSQKTGVKSIEYDLEGNVIQKNFTDGHYEKYDIKTGQITEASNPKDPDIIYKYKYQEDGTYERYKTVANTRIKDLLDEKTFTDGTKESYKYYTKNGKLSTQTLRDGSIQRFDQNGNLEYTQIFAQDGTYKKISPDYKVIEQSLPDGTIQEFSNEVLVKETLPDKTKKIYENGVLQKEVFEDGTIKIYENGKVKTVVSAEQSASEDFNTVEQSAWNEFNAVEQPAWNEFNAVEQSAWNKFDTVSSSARNEYWEGKITQKERDKIINDAINKRDNIINKAKEERDKIINDAKNKRDNIIDKAKKERDKIINDAINKRDNIINNVE